MSARDVKAGGAYVTVSTKDDTAKGLAGISSRLKSFGSSIAKVGGVAIGVASSAGAAAASAVMKSIEVGSTIHDMAKRFGLSFQAVQQLGYAADQSGTSLETLIGGIKKMQQGLGNGTIADDLAKIGVSAEEIRSLAPEQQFAAIAAAIGKITDPAQRTAAAMAIFGKSGADLIPLLSDGKDGVNALVAEFDKMGIAMSDKAVVQAEKLGDDIDKLSKKFGAMGTAIGTTLIPIVDKLLTKIDEAATPTLNEMATHNEGIAAELQRKPGLLMPGPAGWAMDYFLGDDGKAADELKAKSDAHAKAVRDKAGEQVDIANAISARNKAGLRSPVLEFLEDAQKRLARMNSSREGRERGEILDDIFGDMKREWDRIGRGFDRDQVKIKAREARDIHKQIGELTAEGDEIRKRVKSFGSFDKRDLMSGVFQADPQEIAILKSIDANIKRLEQGLPVTP